MITSGNFQLTTEQMQENAIYLYGYMLAQGWTLNAIAGMLGNMQSESRVNPGIWQGLDEGDLSGGYGLVQWTPASKYLDWASANNLVPSEMDSNLQRILYEVAQNIQWGKDSLGNNPPYNFYGFTQSTEHPYTLGINFHRYYERPAVYNNPTRGTQAVEWFDFLGGVVPPMPNNRRKLKPYMATTHRRIYII